MPPVIEAESLTKRFGSRVAIDSVDLAVRAGSCFGFLGPNGAGKTTLIRLLLGLARPDGGQARISGIDVRSDPALALAGVGAIVEEPRFFAHLTGAENLLAHAALVAAGAEQRIPEALARVGLAARGGERVKSYSMGMRQRLGLARALLSDPQILVLDEPTNGLDAEGMAEFRTLIRAMVEQEGRTVFISSHLLDEMQKLCDEVAIVEHGRVVTQASVGELIRGDSATRALVLDCDAPEAAQAVLAAHPAVKEVRPAAPGTLLSITLAGGREEAMALTRKLVEAGIGVAELRSEEQSLEQRYLDITRGARP